MPWECPRPVPEWVMGRQPMDHWGTERGLEVLWPSVPARRQRRLGRQWPSYLALAVRRVIDVRPLGEVWRQGLERGR